MRYMDKEKRILLVSSPFRDLYGKSKRGVGYYFPLGIGYIASYLEQHGYDVELLVETKNRSVSRELKALLARQAYLFVGISAMTSAFPEAVRLAGIVKYHSPQTPVAIGGPHVSAMGPSVLSENPEFDYVCIGEGEVTSLELATALGDGARGFQDVRGLIWRTVPGEIIVNPPRPFQDNIDSFPLPARHLVDFQSFSLSTHVTAGGGTSASMITSRGCPFGCAFCSAHLTVGKKYRFRTEESVIEELKLLIDEYHVGYVFFQDDTFTVAKKRAKSLCRRIIKERLEINFGCFSRVDVFDVELAAVLREAGCRLVIFGIESGVPETLKKIGKRISIRDARKAVGICKALGIQSYASFVVGFPFETVGEIRRTISFGKSLDAFRVTFNPFVPFPGCPLYNETEHRPREVNGWARFLTTGVPPFDLADGISARKVKAIVDRAHLEYYLHPRRLLRTARSIGSIHEFLLIARTALGLGYGLLSQKFSEGRN